MARRAIPSQEALSQAGRIADDVPAVLNAINGNSGSDAGKGASRFSNAGLAIGATGAAAATAAGVAIATAPEPSDGSGVMTAADNVVGATEGLANHAGLALMFGPAILGLAGGLIGGPDLKSQLETAISKASELTGGEKIREHLQTMLDHVGDKDGATFKNAHANLKAEITRIHPEAPKMIVFGEKAAGNGVAKAAAKVESAVASGGSTRPVWMQKVGRVLNWLPKQMDKTFGEIGLKETTGEGVLRPVGNATEWVTKNTGIGNWRANANEVHAAKHHARAGQRLADLTQRAHNLAEGTLKQDVLGHIKKMGEALGGNHADLNPEALETFRTAHKKLTELTAGKHAEELKGLGGFVRNPLRSLGNAVGNVAEHTSNAQGWRNPAQALANLPKKFAGLKTGHVLTNAAFAVAGVAAAYLGVRGTAKKIDEWKHVKAAEQGKSAKDISILEVLGDAESRWSVGKEAAKAGVGVAGAGYMSKKLLATGDIPMVKGFLAPMAAAGAVDIAGGSDPQRIQYYKPFEEAFRQSKGQLPKEAYAQFISLADPHFEALGGNHPITLAVAERLEKEKVTPGQLSAKIKNHELIAYGDQADAAIKAHAASAQVAAAPAAAQAPVQPQAQAAAPQPQVTTRVNTANQPIRGAWSANAVNAARMKEALAQSGLPTPREI